jgi:hypothetical protein
MAEKTFLKTGNARAILDGWVLFYFWTSTGAGNIRFRIGYEKSSP